MCTKSPPRYLRSHLRTPIKCHSHIWICKEQCNGLCCRLHNVRVPLLEKEVKQYPYQVVFQPQAASKTKNKRGLILLKKTVDGRCVFFDLKTSRCKIYKDRPFNCRMWYCGRQTVQDQSWQTMKLLTISTPPNLPVSLYDKIDDVNA